MLNTKTRTVVDSLEVLEVKDATVVLVVDVVLEAEVVVESDAMLEAEALLEMADAVLSVDEVWGLDTEWELDKARGIGTAWMIDTAREVLVDSVGALGSVVLGAVLVIGVVLVCLGGASTLLSNVAEGENNYHPHPSNGQRRYPHIIFVAFRILWTGLLIIVVSDATELIFAVCDMSEFAAEVSSSNGSNPMIFSVQKFR